VLGLILGNFAFNTFIGKPDIGVVKIDTTLYPWTTPDIVKMLNYATGNNTIKAVVLEIDCPGGDAVSAEELYLDIVHLRDIKPVVAYINIVGASGGYYISSAANFIYAKSSSTVGSVGAYVSLPERETLFENIIPTGPNKLTGSSTEEAVNQLEMLKQSFLQAVMFQRGNRLKISKEELSKAGVYNGLEGVRYGLIDNIGSSFDAVQKAAELAGLRNYEVIDINDKLSVSLPPWWENVTPSNTQASKLQEGALPIYYFLYISPETQP
jgi:protease-4